MQLLVVEDDPALSDSLVRALEFEGYSARVAPDAETALLIIRTDVIDGAIVDIGLPGVSGLELIRRLRREGDPVPVLILTARRLTGERIAGLDAGADDYVTKPFELEELLARVRALLRRSVQNLTEHGDLVVGDLRLSPRSREVWRGEHELQLTHTEFELLELLMAHPRQVLSRSQLFLNVWGFDDPTSNTLDVFVSGLRKKTEEWGGPRLIHTVRGSGYVVKPAPES